MVSLGFARESIQAEKMSITPGKIYIGPVEGPSIVMYCNVLLHDVHIARYNITLVTH